MDVNEKWLRLQTEVLAELKKRVSLLNIAIEEIERSIKKEKESVANEEK